MDIDTTLWNLGISSFSDYEKKVTDWESFDTRVWHGGQEKIDSLTLEP